METISRITQKIDAFNEWVGNKVSWLSLALIILVCLDVLRRKLFNQTEAWITELECYLFALIFLLGAGYTYLHDRHVRVDVFYAKQSPKEKAWINLGGICLLLMPWIAVIFYWSVHYAWQSFLVREGSPNPNGLPAVYLIKFAIPLALLLLFLQSISQMGKAILVIKSKNQTEAS